MILLSGPSDQVQQQPALRHHGHHRFRHQRDRQQGRGPAAGTVCVCVCVLLEVNWNRSPGNTLY